jgi:hypothetical protein
LTKEEGQDQKALPGTIVLKPGQAQRADPGLWPSRVEEKIEKIMTRRDPAKLDCNPLTFCFTKTTPF